MSSELQPNLVALQTIVYREVKRFTSRVIMSGVTGVTSLWGLH